MSATCPVCGGPMRPNKYGICSLTPECRRQRDRKRRKDNPRPAGYRREYNSAWKRANPDKVTAQTERHRQRLLAEHLAWREANPNFLADWFEADSDRREDYFWLWAAGNPYHAARLRYKEAEVCRRTGETVSLRPTLARLYIAGREPLYGMSGNSVLRAIPRPSGINYRSWTHAEADVIAQAVAAAWRGGIAELTVDHDPCSNCVAIFAVMARLIDLDELTVIAQGLSCGRYTKAEDRFTTATSQWWSTYCRNLPESERNRLRADRQERVASSEAYRWRDGKPKRIQITSPQRTAAYLRMHMPPEHRRELGRLLLEEDTTPAQSYAALGWPVNKAGKATAPN